MKRTKNYRFNYDGYVGGHDFYLQGWQIHLVFLMVNCFCFGDVTSKSYYTADISDTAKGKGVAAFIGCYEDRDCSNNSSDGNTNTIKFVNCVANGTIEGKEKVAGFIGTSYISSATGDDFVGKTTVIFEDCTNNATIIGVGTDNCRIGGFVGTIAS